MNEIKLKPIFLPSFFIAAGLAIFAEAMRWLALFTGIGGTALFVLNGMYEDFPMLRYVRIPDEYFVTNEVTVSNYVISRFLTFLAWWTLLVVIFAIINTWRSGEGGSQSARPAIVGRHTMIVSVFLLACLLAIGGAGFYLYQKSNKFVGSLSIPEPKFENFIPTGAKLGNADLIANTGRTDEEGAQPGKVFLDLDRDGIQEVAFVYSFPYDQKKSEENIYYTPANGMKILKFNQGSGWGVIYKKEVAESTGDKNYMNLSRIISMTGWDALVVTDFSSGLDWDKTWRILTMDSNQVISLAPSAELLAQVQKYGYDALFHSNIVLTDNEIIETMSGYSQGNTASFIPDKDPVEAHYRFTGSSIELVSFKILKGVNQNVGGEKKYSADSNVDRKIYRNEKYGFDLQYPVGWKVTESNNFISGEQDIAFDSNTNTNGDNQFIINVISPSLPVDTTSPKVWVDTTYPGSINVRTAVVGGMNGFQFSQEGTPQSPAVVTTIIPWSPGKAMEFECAINLHLSDTTNVCDQIVKSVHFTKQ